MNQNNALVIVTLIVVATLTAAATPISYVNVVNAIENTKVVVHAGGGNSTSPITAFVPQQVRVNVGQSVTWDNPSVVGEPHTVTFVLDNKTATDIVSPFAVPNSTQFSSIPPGSNNEPFKAPGWATVSQQQCSSLSLADGLSELAKLKEQGTPSEADFCR